MKRTIISTIGLGVAIVLAVSCNKIEDTPSVVTNGRTVINGVAEAIGTGTKADMAYCYEIIWRVNDQIYVTDGTKDDTFTLSGGAGTTKGQFTEDNDKGITGDIEAFYPASLMTADGYVWPATQTNNQVAPMYAKQSISGVGDETVNFSSLGAMLQIAFSTTASDITVTSIVLKDENKPLSGKFTVTDGQAIMAENAANPGVMLNLGESGVPVGVAATYFYLAIPAGDYNGDKFSLTFTDDVHHRECVMTSTSFPDIKRNTAGRMTLAGNDFKSPTFTVKFDMNNADKKGDFTSAPTGPIVEYNNTVKEPRIPFAQYYGFRGWYKDAACNDAWDFANDKVTSNITLYAKWVEDPAEDKINGHYYVKLAGYYWATENIGLCGGVTPVAYPWEDGNAWGCYYYSQIGAFETAQYWGGEGGHSWTLPSKKQWQTLLNYCDWEWTSDYNETGKSGYVVKGREENFEFGTDHCFFLPSAGIYEKTVLNGQGSTGCYWTGNSGTIFYSREDRRAVSDNWSSNYGMTVRLVAN